MVKKTIPQLVEATTITDNAFFVVDTGSVTKKISKINLKKSMNEKIRHISLTSQTLTQDDDIVIFDSPDAPSGIDFNLPLASESNGKRLTLKNNGTGNLVGYGNAYGVSKIDGADEIDLTGLNKSATIVCDGTHWYIVG